MDEDTVLLRAILSMTARQAFSVEDLEKLVAPAAASNKQRAAFNMCDGQRSQTEIAKTLKLDSGNFSRTVARWVAAGIVLRIGGGKEPKLLHVYPLPAK
jgi:hypothetical protein